jgi:diguanylate cyclase
MDTEKARRLFETALTFMQKHGVAITPATLVAWFAYAEKGDPQWNQRLDQLVANKGLLPTTRMDEDVCHYLLGMVECRSLFNGVNGLFTTIQTVSSVVVEAETDAKRFGEALTDVRHRLEGDVIPPETVRRTVDEVIALTEEMTRREEEFLRKLAASSEEVVLLRNKLEEIHRRAVTDPLTGLVNEKYFVARLREIVEQTAQTGGVLSIAVADIDRFGSFATQHGGETGDGVLKLVASIVAGATREADITGRTGDDEFGLILIDTPQEEAHKLTERIRSNLANRNLVKRGTSEVLGKITVSAGVATYVAGETVESFLGRAHAALKLAKTEGGNRSSVAG